MGTTTTLKLAAAAAALTTTAGLAAAAPATAETQTHRDPRGDVEVLRDARAAPRPGIDITRVENTYRARTLTVELTFADLQRNGYSAQWEIRAGEQRYTLVLDRFGGEEQVYFYGGVIIGRRPGVEPGCEGVDVQRRGDTLTGTVPRRCLEGADEVRVAGYTSERRADGPQRIDDSRRDGIGDARGAKFGPVLERN